jgi:TatD DNase family protein
MGEEALALGFYISFSGIVTFDKAEELREFAKTVPAERILVETDSPYLAPVPHRGEINQPALVGHTGACVARLRQAAPEEIAALSKRNFFTLFDKARQEGARA